MVHNPRISQGLRDDGRHHWSLVLAGGDGTRLQELTALISGRPIPKQYCQIIGGKSLLEATIERVAPLAGRERSVAIINRNHVAMAEPQLASLPTQNVIVQPRNCDTGPGLLLSLLMLQRRDPHATVAVFPSDHYIADADAFRSCVERARIFVAQQPQALVLLGIEPDRPEAGYGYIEPGRPLTAAGSARAYTVAAFREKPSVPQARSMIARGGLWNSFVMVFRVARVLELLAQVRPADFVAMQALTNQTELDEAYARLTPWNFSSGFLARIPEHLAVVTASDTGWSDWGTRESIERTFAQLQLTPPWHRVAPRVGIAA
ncbi:MAG: NTP transferase domain-containing protein [Deltaproteobacteria bacterium]|nr:NTP transferase domain-containing protein [Deltaproteobacteria bacterium]